MYRSLCVLVLMVAVLFVSGCGSGVDASELSGTWIPHGEPGQSLVIDIEGGKYYEPRFGWEGPIEVTKVEGNTVYLYHPEGETTSAFRFVDDNTVIWTFVTDEGFEEDPITLLRQ